MLNSVNDKSPLILQGIIKPERTIYLPGNRGPIGESGEVTKAQMEAYVSDAVANKVTKTTKANKLYGTGADGLQSEYFIGSAVVGGVPVVLDRTFGDNAPSGNGVLLVNIPIKDYQAANKKYVDSGLKDKVTKTTEAYKIYGTGHGGREYLYPCAIDSIRDTVPIRNYNGEIMVNAPTENLHAANKQYVDEKVAAVATLSFKVVYNLPTTDIKTNIIYLLASGGAEQNVYDEYIYVNNAWEKIGTTVMDLAEYAKKTEAVIKNSETANTKGDYFLIGTIRFHDSCQGYNGYVGLYEYDGYGHVEFSDGNGVTSYNSSNIVYTNGDDYERPLNFRAGTPYSVVTENQLPTFERLG